MIGLETRSLLVEDRILKDFDWTRGVCRREFILKGGI
jgi:hypothetical protein